MSKENMSKKNILDYDEEKTIRPQNFTLTAMKEFYDTIESDQFQGASEDTIYKYLTNIMEIVSFKDFLRRYIYEYAGIKENFKRNYYQPDDYWNCSWTSLVSMPSSIFRNPGEDGDKYWKHGNSDGTYGNGSDL